MRNIECETAPQIEAAKARLRVMRERELSAEERLEAHALANAITQAQLRAYFAAEKPSVLTEVLA